VNHIRIGNVIQSPDGGRWIVTEVHDHTIEAVAFDAENASAVQYRQDRDQDKTCEGCLDHPDTDCSRCGGTGYYTERVRGWDRSKVLAPHVKAFILNRVKKVFGL
jgi:hypothetical protein